MPHIAACMCYFKAKEQKEYISKLFSLWFLLKGAGGGGTPSNYPQEKDMDHLPSLTAGGDQEMTPLSLSFHICEVGQGEVHVQEPF